MVCNTVNLTAVMMMRSCVAADWHNLWAVASHQVESARGSRTAVSYMPPRKHLKGHTQSRMSLWRHLRMSQMPCAHRTETGLYT